VCDSCKRLEAERDSLVEEVSGLMLTVRQQGRHIGSLKRELTRLREDSPDADLTRRTLTYWHAKLGKDDRVKIGLTGKRADRVRWAIRLGYGPEDFKAMVDALKVYPFVVFGSRRASGSADSRRDDILDGLKDEKSIEQLIRLARTDVYRGEQMTTDEAAA
jgi:hypothetical protein